MVENKVENQKFLEWIIKHNKKVKKKQDKSEENKK